MQSEVQTLRIEVICLSTFHQRLVERSDSTIILQLFVDVLRKFRELGSLRTGVTTIMLGIDQVVSTIAACVDAVDAHAGKKLDEFDVAYEGALLSFSKARWTGVECEVTLATVWSLVVDGRMLVVEGFSGEAAKAEYERLKAKTEAAVATLNTREDILHRRLAEAEQRLKEPNPNVSEITARVDEGILKATGQ